jgi:2-dehydro-3-deoxyphosphogluconate aldolase/(4S)-4-hydroxy-2-oxoglutarate aldolase
VSSVAQLLGGEQVLPIATIERLEEAVPIARALVAGGHSALEVTLRTPPALEAIVAISAEVPELVVGAGTVRHPDQVEAAREAGARFLASPAITAMLLDEFEDCGLPVLCGVATPTGVARVLDRGFLEMKLFPAEAIGGAALLQALGGPFPEASFCPTGGIGPARAADYLALPNVFAVGGSWVTDRLSAATY